jgi:drug/metabolite transporter (DMT)-like permease
MSGEGPPSQSAHAAAAAKNLRAILWMVLSVGFLAAVDGLAKTVAQDLHPFQIVFFRNFFGAFCLVPFFLRYGLHHFRTERTGFHIIRGAVHVIGMLAWFTALTLIPLAEATALSFLLPMYASLGAILFLGEPNRLNRWISILVALIGMLIILRPGVVPVSFGAILVLLGGVTAAVSKIMTKSLARTDSPLTIVGYMTLVLTVVSLVPALFVWQTPSLSALALMALMGATGTGAHYLMTMSYRDGDLTLVEPATFGRLVWAALFGFIFFQEAPEIWTWIGSAVIIASATYLARIESK